MGDRSPANPDSESRIPQPVGHDERISYLLGLRRLSTAFLVASLPAPAVVGTAINGVAGPVIGFFRPNAFQIIQDRSAAGQQPGNGLGGIQGAAAANADDDSNLRAVELLNRSIHQFWRRFIADPDLFPVNIRSFQRRQQFLANAASLGMNAGQSPAIRAGRIAQSGWAVC